MVPAGVLRIPQPGLRQLPKATRHPQPFAFSSRKCETRRDSPRVSRKRGSSVVWEVSVGQNGDYTAARAGSFRHSKRHQCSNPCPQVNFIGLSPLCSLFLASWCVSRKYVWPRCTKSPLVARPTDHMAYECFIIGSCLLFQHVLSCPGPLSCFPALTPAGSFATAGLEAAEEAKGGHGRGIGRGHNMEGSNFLLLPEVVSPFSHPSPVISPLFLPPLSSSSLLSPLPLSSLLSPLSFSLFSSLSSPSSQSQTPLSSLFSLFYFASL
jgi:hypothetical protein